MQKIFQQQSEQLWITLLLTVLIIFIAIPIHAQESDDAQKTRRTPTMSEQNYKKISKAQELSDAKDYAGALDILNRMKSDSKLSDYEKAMVWNNIGYIYSVQDQYKPAIQAFQQVLAQPDLPEALQIGSLYSLAQLYMVTEQYKEAVDVLNKWFRLNNTPNPSAHILLGQAYFQMQNYQAAIKETEQALAISAQQQQQPQEQWLLVLRAAYYETGNIAKTIEILGTLVNLYPKRVYFSQLSSLYGDQGNEKQQLLVLEAAFDGGYFEQENEYVSLASLLLSNDVPYKAANVLQAGLDKKIVKPSVENLSLLGQAWQLAEEPEKSIAILQQAAQKSDNGELYIRVGQSYANLDQWRNCISSINTGLNKGGVKRPDNANFTLGICLYNDNKLDQAMSAFTQAAKSESNRQGATQWIAYIEAEKDRKQKLAIE